MTWIPDTIRQESVGADEIGVIHPHNGHVIEFAPSPADHPAVRWTGSGLLPGQARRIVSLLPSATEIVCALNLADRLVAVTHECDYPAAALEGVPRITANRLPPEVSGSRDIDAAVRSALTSGHGIYDLDEARMAELQPDLVLTQELCRVCAVAYPMVVEAARSAGGADGPVVVSLEPHSLADVLATIEVVARMAGVEERGRVLVDELRRRVDGVPRTKSPRRVAVIEWLDPLFAPGHWVPEQVVRAGGAPAIGWAGEPSRELEWKDLAEADPEVIVLGLCGFDLPTTLIEWASFEPPEPLTRPSAWRAGDVWAIDGSAYVSRPGPRLADGVEILAAILSGARDPRAARIGN